MSLDLVFQALRSNDRAAVHAASIVFDRAVCRQSLSTFVRRAWHRLEPEERPLLWSWHMEAICDHLTAVSMGHLRNLVISVPPGFSKSMLAAVMWQAWEWGPLDRPYTRVLTASYNYALAERDASRFLRLIRSQWYQERWPILLDRVTLRKIQTANGGFRMPTSIGGIATGERADHFVVDDPLSAEQANSAAERARAARWIRESVPSRLVDARRSSIVIIAQRLHSDDVSGIALREMGFVELKLPMRYERGGTARTPIGPGGRVIEGGYDWERRTVEGELLDPQRFPEEDVRRLEAQMGPYAVAGQLQQRPSPRGGGFIQIEQMEIVADFPRNAAMVRVWDFAATTPGITAADPDYTAGVLAAALDGILYIVDVARFRADPGTVERRIRQTAELDGQRVKVIIKQEPGAAGKSIVEYYRRRVLPEFATNAVLDTKDKVTRAQPFASAVNAGRVKLVRGAWNHDFLMECESFPLGSHDDQVDAAADAFTALMARPGFQFLGATGS